MLTFWISSYFTFLVNFTFEFFTEWNWIVNKTVLSLECWAKPSKARQARDEKLADLKTK